MSVFSRTGFSAKSYAAFRPTYPQDLYTAVLSYIHGNVETARKTKPFQCLVDLGCGHGIAATSLASNFVTVHAIDPSQIMIQQAESQATEKNVQFRVGSAEDLSFIPSQSVDLVVSAQAAHWFDYKKLWPELARVVKPKGAIAFWGYKDNIILGAPEANKIFDRFIYGEGEVAPGIQGLGPYWEQPGRNILRDLYRSIQPPTTDWEDIIRHEHEPGEMKDEKPAWTLRKTMSLGAVDSYCRTFSSYKAWQDKYLPQQIETQAQSRLDVFDVMWEKAITATKPWNERRDSWRDIDIVTEWGTCLLMARRR